MSTSSGPFAGYPSSQREQSLRSTLRMALFLAITLAVWLSTKPFMHSAPLDGMRSSGDLANQLVFSGLAAFSGVMLLYVDRRALLPLVQPSTILLGLWLVVCVMTSTQRDISTRAFSFTIIIMFLAAVVLTLPQDRAQFTRLLMIAVGTVLVISYIGIVAVPGAAKHTDFDVFEPEHAGSWRGVFDHKNIAGAMMGIFTITGVFFMRSGRPVGGALLALGSFVFLYFTKSKTSLVLTPVVILLVYAAATMRPLAARLMILLGLILSQGGCSNWRAEREVIIAPDPMMYPAPALDQRYVPWIHPGGTPFRA